MKKIIGLALICCNLIADIDFTQIKGLYTIFRAKKYLSPIHGFAWASSDQVRELYSYGDADHKTIQLIQELFHLNLGDGFTFTPTILPIKIGTYFTPRIIGIILNELDPYAEQLSLSSSEENRLKKTVEEKLAQELNFNELLSQSKIKQEQLKTQLIPQIKKFNDEAKSFSSKADELESEKKSKEKEVSELKQKVAQLRSQRNSLKKSLSKSSEFSEKLAEKENEIKSKEEQLRRATLDLEKVSLVLKGVKESKKKKEATIRLLENKIKNEALPNDALKEFVELLIDAFKETFPGDNQRYVPYTIHNVMLAFLWMRSNDKYDFIKYLKSLDKIILQDPSILSDNSPAQRRWLKESYAKKEYLNTIPFLQKALMINEQEFRSLFINNYEQLIEAWYSYAIYTSSFPPQVLTGWLQYKDFDFADCVSTEIRNFFNILLFNIQKGELDLSLLPHDLQLNPKFKQFFTTYNTLESIQERKTREAWIAVTSELNNSSMTIDQRIYYKNPSEDGICEIAAWGGIRNVSNVIRQLIGVDLDGLIDLLRKSNVLISLEKQLRDDGNFGIITFHLTENRTFKWYFYERHPFIETTPHFYNTSPIMLQAMKKIISLLENNNNPTTYMTNDLIFNLIMLSRDKSDLYDSMITTVQMKNFNEATLVHSVLILLDSRLQDNKYAFIREILRNHATRSNNRLFHIIEKIIKEIIWWAPWWEFTYTHVIKILLQSYALSDEDYRFKEPLNKIVREQIDVIRNKYPYAMPEIITTILTNKNKSFYGLIKKQQFTQTQLQLIIANKINDFYSAVRNYLTTLKLPLNEQDRMLVAAIYQNKITDFDDVLNKKLDDQTRAELKSKE